MFKVPEKYRVKTGPLASDASHGNNGAFILPITDEMYAVVIASDGEGWEHVSVSVKYKEYDLTPNWTLMCEVKDSFWDNEDCVVQYHPPKSDYVNCHEHTLHLWRPVNQEILRPPSYMVGPKKKT